MISKEKILAANWMNKGNEHEASPMVLRVMDEYAKEVAIEYDEWKRQHEWVLSARYPNKWYENIDDTELIYYTNEQLFELYKKENP